MAWPEPQETHQDHSRCQGSELLEGPSVGQTQGWDSRAVTCAPAVPLADGDCSLVHSESPSRFIPTWHFWLYRAEGLYLPYHSFPPRHLLTVSTHGGQPPQAPIHPSTRRRPNRYTCPQSMPGWGTAAHLLGDLSAGSQVL